MRNNFFGIFIIPFIALSVVTQLYLLLPVSQNMTYFVEGATTNNVGWLTTLFGVFYSAGLIFWGGLSDKVGRGRILVIGLLLLAGVSFTIPFIENNYFYLLIARMLQGFFASSFPPVAIAWISVNLQDSSKPIAISIISCAFLLAGTIGQLFAISTISLSLNSAMWSLALVYFLGALLLCFVGFISKPQNMTTANASVLSIFKQLPEVLFNKSLFKIYLCTLFVLMSFVSLYTVLHQGTIAASMPVLRNLGIIAMLFSLTASYVFKMIKPISVLAISLSIIGISLLMHLFYIYDFIQDKNLLYIIHFIFIFGIAYAVPSMITCVATLSDIKIRGIATSLYACILFIGASLGTFFPIFISGGLLLFMISVCLLFCSIQLVLFRLKQ